MNESQARHKIERLRQLISHHDYLYYVRNQPAITDREYDRLYRTLLDLEREFPGLVTPDSPTQRVGGQPLKDFKPVQHRLKMYSLDNTYSEEELRDFDRRVSGALGRSTPYEVSLKIDGVAVTMIYADGRLRTGATRGDGTTGDDITQNLRTLRSVPLRLLTDDPSLLDIEVRGEVFLSRDKFQRLNQERRDIEEAEFANPRNAAAGTLKLLDAREVARRELDLFIHTVPTAPDARRRSHYETLLVLGKAGFKVVPGLARCRTINDVIEYISSWDSKRDKLDFEVDGIVVKVDDFHDREDLGATMKSPRWAIAYKYPTRQATTRLTAINLQVGRTGRITPVAVLEPVFLSGSTISRATLHNEDEINRKDIRVGDFVIIEKGGEVIPKVVGVKTEQRTGALRTFRFPRTCPVCRETIVRLPGEADWRCVNSSCLAQVKGSILHFASRPGMDIEGLGWVLVDKLVDQGLVKSFDQLYRLDAERLAELERMGKKSAANLTQAIQASKGRPFVNVLFALGIPNIGLNTAHLLVEKFETIDALMGAGLDDLSSVPGIGEVIGQSLVSYFKGGRNRTLIRKLLDLGLQFRAEHPAGATPLKGKVIVFTGQLPTLTRSEAQELVHRAGGHPSSSVSRATDYVVAGSEPGVKYEQAKKLGIAIITEREFLALVKDLGKERS